VFLYSIIFYRFIIARLRASEQKSALHQGNFTPGGHMESGRTRAFARELPPNGGIFELFTLSSEN
jgi:hypothetical protein